MARGDRLRRFLVDAKRRGTFRAGAFYAVAAWVLVQAASIAFPAFGFPDWAMRAVLVVAVAGFPVAMILGWTFDINARGWEITPAADGETGRASPGRHWIRPLVAAPLIAAVVGSATWVWSARLADPAASEFTGTVEPGSTPVVAVMPLENLTGRPDLDWAGNGLATLVRDDLARSHRLAVVSSSRTIRFADKSLADRHARLMVHASESGVTHVVTGELLRTPKGLTIASRITDLRRSLEIGSHRQRAMTPEELLAASTPIAMMVKQSLGLPGTESVDVFAADFAAQNIAAYESFIAGMENFLRFDYPGARIAFESAVAKAPDFAMARYRLAHTLAMLGETGSSLEQIELARRDSKALPELEQLYIAAAERYFARDYPGAEQRYRAILASYPYETEARLLLVYVLEERKPSEALRYALELSRQEPDSEVAWGAVGYLALRLRRFEEAEPALARYVQLAPENPNAHLLLGDAALFRRRYEEARTHYEAAIAKDPTFASAHLQLGYLEAMTRRWQEAMTRFTSIARSPEFNPTDRITAAFEWASLLRADGRCAQAEQVLDSQASSIEREQIRVALALEFRAYCALDRGDEAEAIKLARQAVRKSPGTATRYRFAQGLAEIRARDFGAARKTIDAIVAEQAARDVGDEASLKAADYLSGMLALAQNRSERAILSFQSAIDRNGKAYDLYQVGLAEAQLASGQPAAAAATLQDALREPPADDPRLDLELSRRRAGLLLLRLPVDARSPAASRAIADELKSLWARADAGFEPRQQLLALDDKR